MYLALLKAFLNYETYSKYGDYLDYTFIKENHPEVFRLFQCVRDLHKDQLPKQYSVEDLELRFGTLYPQSKASDFSPFFSELRDKQSDPDAINGYLLSVRTRSQATLLAKAALGVAEGTKTDQELQDVISAFQQQEITKEATDDFVETDIRIIHAKRLLQPGLRWRLDSLNKALGSIRKGTAGLVFGRPERGKTAFLCSEVTYMAESCPDLILWFNNEEEHEAVTYRLYQAAFGIDLPTLLSRLDYYAEAYLRGVGTRIRLISETPTTKRLVERVCQQYPASLILFDQVDKVQGFADDREDLELQAIYEWTRELAKRYAPVINVCQAGATAEGKRWLTMNDVNNSKTGKAGEMDWILGIGAVPDDGLEFFRYMHLSKNKLPGGDGTDPTMRHGKFEVCIRPDIVRYEDIA